MSQLFSKKFRQEPDFISNLSSDVRIGKASIDISGKMKVLKDLADKTKNPENVHSIILQLILPTTVEYIEIVNKV